MVYSSSVMVLPATRKRLFDLISEIAPVVELNSSGRFSFLWKEIPLAALVVAVVEAPAIGEMLMTHLLRILKRSAFDRFG